MTPGKEGKLSKEEVEALLTATEVEEEAAGGEPEPVETSRRVHAYDFTQPSRFSRLALEQLRRINEGVAQGANRVASRLMRTGIKTQLVSMEQMKWESLVEEVGDSVVAFVLRFDPFDWLGVLTIDRTFAAICLDRLTGGPGEAPTDTTFSDLDSRVLATLVRGFLAPLPELWEALGPFTVEPAGFSEDLAAMDLFTPSEDLFQLCFLLQGSMGSGQVTLSVPFRAVKSLPPSDDPARGPAVAESEEATLAALQESVTRSRVDVSALLGSADVKVADLIQMEPGDVLVLSRRVGDALDVRINDRRKLHAHPGVREGNYAVKLIIEE